MLRIPVSLQYENSWFWAGDPKGCYTVKEGYRRVIGNFEHTPDTFDNWLHLWKIKCPAKWKTFIWRALTNSLPTTTNLIIKRVEIDPSCPMCGTLHENIMHSLVLCDYSKLVWNESSLHVSNMSGSDFGGWFDNVIAMLTEDNIIYVVALLYHIWKARNSAVWDACLLRPSRVWFTAHAAAQAWKEVHVSPHPQQQPAAVIAQPGVPQCFIDAGFDPHSGTATVGAVLLSQHGGFVAAFNSHLPSCDSPLMAEALACKEALSWLKGRNLHSVCIYTDCSTLKNLLTMDNTSLFSYVRYFVDAIRAIMSTFTSCSVNFIPRTANRGAHVLATLAYSQLGSLFWDSIPPNSISELI
ncbi:uncharacterized protein LOC116023599 [Ipomoea triloba]|uniref:uncharacterized protein LOC116023599 n=1 Tax=Ipomoea triloba TaxID=35885 RepID=UPI00125DE6FC|nr:uncharacterized protein LOC116023599 [Ipomoea triloba]